MHKYVHIQKEANQSSMSATYKFNLWGIYDAVNKYDWLRSNKRVEEKLVRPQVFEQPGN